LYVLKTLNNNDNQQYISYIPKFHRDYKMKKYYDATGEELNIDIDDIYIKPDVVAIIAKFDDVYSYVNEIFEYDQQFYKDYEKFLLKYLNADINDRMGVWIELAPSLITRIDEIYEEMEIAKTLNVNENSSFKLNITLDEAKYIMLTSIRCRFFIPCFLGGTAVNEHQQKVIHSIMNYELIERKILNKIFNIVSSMVVSSTTKFNGKKIWSFLSRAKGYTQENHIFELISSIYYKAIPSLKPSENPIAYLISVAKNELNWLLQTAMTNLFLPSTVDTISMIKPKNDLIQSEIFYKVIVQKLFFPIIEAYEDYKELYHYNVYPTIYNITQPLILQIFNLPIKALNISNPHVLNFFTHRFLLSINELRRPNMEAMLLTAPSINLDLKDLERLPDQLIQKVTTTLKPYLVTKKITHLTLNTIKKYYINTILALYKYRYYDVITKQYITIDWNKFIEEIISFTINLSIGSYQKEIGAIKKQLDEY